MHSYVWSVVKWPSRAAFLQVWAADDIRELWKVVVSYLSDGVQRFLMCCVIFLGHIQGFGLEVAVESHPDASALDQRVPSAALTNIWMCPSVTGGLPSLVVFISTLFFVSRQLVICFQVQADVPLRPHLPFSLPFPSSIPGV